MPDPWDGFPLGDIAIFQFLSMPSKVLPVEVMDLEPSKVIYLSFLPIGQVVDTLQSEEIAAAFLGALFAVLHETIEDARHGHDIIQAKKVFNAAWGIPDITHPEDSPCHKNFMKVQDKAISLLVTEVKEVSKKWAIRTVSTKSSPQIPQGEKDNSGNQMEISAVSVVSSNSAAKLEATKGAPSTSEKNDPGGESKS